MRVVVAIKDFLALDSGGGILLGVAALGGYAQLRAALPSKPR
jgi:hypothetical protein